MTVVHIMKNFRFPLRWIIPSTARLSAPFFDGSFARDQCCDLRTKEIKFGKSISGASIILVDPHGRSRQYGLTFEFPTSNNVVEYDALMSRL
ncbi:hypothetical protein V6Z11_D13G093500 [Gossypium hirsutum]